MKLVRNWRDGAIVIVAIAISCSLTTMCQVLADPEQESPRSVQTSSSGTIPFDPPVIYPGWPLPNDGSLKQERLRRNVPQPATRDLMFHNEDRTIFRALHPFMLREPRALSVRQGPRGKAPLAPDSKHRRAKI